MKIAGIAKKWRHRNTRSAENRNKAKTNIGTKITSENLVGKMLQNKANWKALSEMISTIVKKKSEDERTKRKNHYRKQHHDVVPEKVVPWCFCNVVKRQRRF